MNSIAILDTKTDRRTELERFLAGTGKIHVIASPPPDSVACEDFSLPVDAVIVMHDDPGQDGLSQLAALKARDASLPVILVTDHYDHRAATGALRLHAPCLVMPEPVASSGPLLLQAIGTALDEGRARQEISTLKKKLELVGSVTRHDVLNQLTAIMGYNELLLMIIEDPTQKTYLEKEKRAVDKIRNQFQFAKDYQNLGIEPPRWQMIRRAVHHAGELFDLKTITVTNTCGEAVVCADPLFEKAVAYLFENAVHFSGTVTEIHVFLEETQDGAVLVFADNGEGVPVAHKPKIFNRGFGKNTGWGLFLTREILAMTKITIAETGEPGKGTRFEMHIPAPAFRREGEKPTT